MYARHNGLFVNHTHINRDTDRLYFFARANWNQVPHAKEKGERINIPFTVNLHGSNLTLHKQHIGGHPEWDEGPVVIGSLKQGGHAKQICYNTDTQQIIGQHGDSKMFPNPDGDIAHSADAHWFVGGYKPSKESTENFYDVYHQPTGGYALSPGVYKGPYSKNRDARIDPAPRWDRTHDKILTSGVGRNNKRQLFLIEIK